MQSKRRIQLWKMGTIMWLKWSGRKHQYQKRGVVEIRKRISIYLQKPLIGAIQLSPQQVGGYSCGELIKCKISKAILQERQRMQLEACA